MLPPNRVSRVQSRAGFSPVFPPEPPVLYDTSGVPPLPSVERGQDVLQGELAGKLLHVEEGLPFAEPIGPGIQDLSAAPAAAEGHHSSKTDPVPQLRGILPLCLMDAEHVGKVAAPRGRGTPALHGGDAAGGAGRARGYGLCAPSAPSPGETHLNAPPCFPAALQYRKERAGFPRRAPSYAFLSVELMDGKP